MAPFCAPSSCNPLRSQLFTLSKRTRDPIGLYHMGTIFKPILFPRGTHLYLFGGRKRAIAKALQLKGHSDFAPVDLAYYQHFLGFLFENIAFWEVPPGNYKCRLTYLMLTRCASPRDLHSRGVSPCAQQGRSRDAIYYFK